MNTGSTLTRRGLLGVAAGGALVATAAVTAGCTGDEEPKPTAPSSLNPRDWASVRAQFRLDSRYTQMAAFVFASHPEQVRTAIERHRQGLDIDPIGYLDANEARLDRAATEAAATYLGATADQIATTDSTTMGLALLYSGLKLQAGDEILTTEHDFYATHESLRLLAERDGVTVRRVRLFADPSKATVDEIISNLRAALTERTRVVAVTWVHSSTGVRLPIKEISAAVRERGDALVCVDGVHGFGAVDATVEQLGADFLVSGCHKWLFGPRGTGVIWGSERGWERYRPVIPSFDRTTIGNWMLQATRPVPPGVAATPGGYHSFEHRWAVTEAFAFHGLIGRPAVAARTAELAKRLKDGLAGIRGVTVHTPVDPALSAGLVCCSLAGMQPAQAVARLRDEDVIASVTPYATSYLRFGASIATDERGVDKVLETVREMV